MKKALQVILVLITTNLSMAKAQSPVEEPLWVANTEKMAGFTPTITIYRPLPDKRQDVAVVVCPGGGYSHLATDHEGKQVAEWLNTLGVTAIVLKYHHTSAVNNQKGLHPLPLQEVQQAIITVRHRADELGISPNKIGVLGFSAGGHLASTAATHFSKLKSDKTNGATISSRPDFAILVYPVITFNPPYRHTGSMKNLLGENPSDSLINEFSNELQVSPETPPTFLVHTNEDTGVPAENSLMFYSALRKADVPAELHIFQKGHHGLGLGSKELPFSTWPALCEKWMQNTGILAEPER